MNSKYQQGVVLVVALIMLLVMTMVGVTIMSGATLQERMAGNNLQLSLARMNAEAALRQAEVALEGMNITSTNNVTPRDVIANNFNGANDGKYILVPESNYDGDVDALTADLSDATGWTANNSITAVTTVTGSISPRYTIEYIGRIKHGNFSAGIDVSVEKLHEELKAPFGFRITAIGYGANDKIYSILQSIYSTDLN